MVSMAENLVCGCSTSRNTALVTTPRIPSAPINSCLRSIPELSLRRFFRFSMMVPSGSTTSSPNTQFRVMPYRNTRKPPALVEMIPPTCADPLAPKLRGKNNCSCWAASRTFSSTAPACAAMVRFWVSTGSMAFIFSSDITS